MIKIKKQYIFLAISFLVFLSCRSTHIITPKSGYTINLTNEKISYLLPTNSYKGKLEIMQVINGSYGKNSFDMQVFLYIDAESISIVAMSLMGNTVYDVLYTNDTITLNSKLNVSDSSSLYMINDVQLCYYPEDVLKQSLQNSGFTLIVHKTDSGWIREVKDGDLLIILIEKSGSSLVYKNILRSYRYTIEEVEL